MKWLCATGTDVKTYDDLTYSASEVQDDESLNAEINLTEYVEDDSDDSTIATIHISSEIDNSSGNKVTVFTTSTEIPIIPIDMYSLSSGMAQIFDIDFFSESNTNTNSTWKLFKSIATIVGRGVLYISAALIITMIIWRGILLVISSFTDNPGGAARSREIMDKIVQAIAMMVGIYVIMTAIVYLYQNILSMFVNGDESGYLIRINVEDVYSFNTNIIGYLRFRGESARAWPALGYSCLYLLMAVVNVLYFGLMCLRSIGIVGLIIIAPLTTVNTMLERTPQSGGGSFNILRFENWIETFACMVCFPMIAVILIRLAMFIV